MTNSLGKGYLGLTQPQLQDQLKLIQDNDVSKLYVAGGKIHKGNAIQRFFARSYNEDHRIAYQALKLVGYAESQGYLIDKGIKDSALTKCQTIYNSFEMDIQSVTFIESGKITQLHSQSIASRFTALFKSICNDKHYAVTTRLNQALQSSNYSDILKIVMNKRISPKYRHAAVLGYMKNPALLSKADIASLGPENKKEHNEIKEVKMILEDALMVLLKNKGVDAIHTLRVLGSIKEGYLSEKVLNEFVQNVTDFVADEYSSRSVLDSILKNGNLEDAKINPNIEKFWGAYKGEYTKRHPTAPFNDPIITFLNANRILIEEGDQNLIRKGDLSEALENFNKNRFESISENELINIIHDIGNHKKLNSLSFNDIIKMKNKINNVSSKESNIAKAYLYDIAESKIVGAKLRRLALYELYASDKDQPRISIESLSYIHKNITSLDLSNELKKMIQSLNLQKAENDGIIDFPNARERFEDAFPESLKKKGLYHNTIANTWEGFGGTGYQFGLSTTGFDVLWIQGFTTKFHETHSPNSNCLEFLSKKMKAVAKVEAIIKLIDGALGNETTKITFTEDRQPKGKSESDLQKDKDSVLGSFSADSLPNPPLGTDQSENPQGVIGTFGDPKLDSTQASEKDKGKVLESTLTDSISNPLPGTNQAENPEGEIDTFVDPKEEKNDADEKEKLESILDPERIVEVKVLDSEDGFEALKLNDIEMITAIARKVFPKQLSKTENKLNSFEMDNSEYAISIRKEDAEAIPANLEKLLWNTKDRYMSLDEDTGILKVYAGSERPGKTCYDVRTVQIFKKKAAAVSAE